MLIIFALPSARNHGGLDVPYCISRRLFKRNQYTPPKCSLLPVSDWNWMWMQFQMIIEWPWELLSDGVPRSTLPPRVGTERGTIGAAIWTNFRPGQGTFNKQSKLFFLSPSVALPPIFRFLCRHSTRSLHFKLCSYILALPLTYYRPWASGPKGDRKEGKLNHQTPQRFTGVKRHDHFFRESATDGYHYMASFQLLSYCCYL